MKRQGSEFLKIPATAANPEKDFNDRDETESETKSKETSCICNKAKKSYFNISFNFGHIWTLNHEINQSQVVSSISIQLINKCFIGFIKFLEVV